MNLCIFIGNAVRDADLKGSSTGMGYVRFPIAINGGYGDKKTVNYFDLVAFGKTAEAISKYVRTGVKYAFTCEAKQDKYTNKNGDRVSTISFVVKDFEFVQPKTANSTARSVEGETPEGFINLDQEVGDEVPFN